MGLLRMLWRMRRSRLLRMLLRLLLRIASFIGWRRVVRAVVRRRLHRRRAGHARVSHLSSHLPGR